MTAPCAGRVRALAERLRSLPMTRMPGTETWCSPDWFEVAGAALAFCAQEQPTYADALTLARGCHDYGGGFAGKEYDAFQGGIGTVVTVLEHAGGGIKDYQQRVTYAIGAEREPEERYLRCVEALTRAERKLREALEREGLERSRAAWWHERCVALEEKVEAAETAERAAIGWQGYAEAEARELRERCERVAGRLADSQVHQRQNAGLLTEKMYYYAQLLRGELPLPTGRWFGTGSSTEGG